MPNHKTLLISAAFWLSGALTGTLFGGGGGWYSSSSEYDVDPESGGSSSPLSLVTENSQSGIDGLQDIELKKRPSPEKGGPYIKIINKTRYKIEAKFLLDSALAKRINLNPKSSAHRVYDKDYAGKSGSTIYLRDLRKNTGMLEFKFNGLRKQTGGKAYYDKSPYRKIKVEARWVSARVGGKVVRGFQVTFK